jgi:8-amino-7-oxononanoate synthase
LEIAAESDGLRQSLRSNIQTFVNSARNHALPLLPSTTAIQPVMTLSNGRTMAVSAHLRENGFFVQGIRPPTVKPGEARLRVTLSAAHNPADIHLLTAAIRAALDAVPA